VILDDRRPRVCPVSVRRQAGDWPGMERESCDLCFRGGVRVPGTEDRRRSKYRIQVAVPGASGDLEIGR
jgi:hypothetical protein